MLILDIVKIGVSLSSLTFYKEYLSTSPISSPINISEHLTQKPDASSVTTIFDSHSITSKRIFIFLHFTETY